MSRSRSTCASATWASLHFNRTAPIRPAANAGLHRERFGGFQASRHGLLSVEGEHEYEAYIWPFFMEQQGGESKIADTWIRFGNLDTHEQATQALNRVLSFEENFHLFAIRNTNQGLLPGDPVRPRYVALDDTLPDDDLLPVEEHLDLVGDVPYRDRCTSARWRPGTSVSVWGSTSRCRASSSTSAGCRGSSTCASTR